MQILHSQLTLHVGDLEASIAFYEKIGFSLQQKWGTHYALVSAPGIEIGLHPVAATAPSEQNGGISIGFTSTDFETTKNELKALGIAIKERKEDGGDFIHFSDPDGTALYFIQAKGY